MIELLAILAAVNSPSTGDPKLRAPPSTVQAVPEPKPAAPAFKPGMAVLDRGGGRIGVIQALSETPGGLNVVVEIDGKLVGVQPSSLSLRGETAVSAQTKAEILARAGAPK